MHLHLQLFLFCLLLLVFYYDILFHTNLIQETFLAAMSGTGFCNAVKAPHFSLLFKKNISVKVFNLSSLETGCL